MRAFVIQLLLVIAIAGLSPRLTYAAKCLEKVLHEVLQDHVFFTSRTFIDYLSHFGPEFADELSRLTSNQVWLDGGCGEGLGLKTYYADFSPIEPWAKAEKYFENEKVLLPFLKTNSKKSPQEKAKAIGITFSTEVGSLPEHRADAIDAISGISQQDPGNRLKILTGRTFDQISNDEIGRVDLITDLHGILAYAPDFDTVLNRYLSLLNKDGSIFMTWSLSTTVCTAPGYCLALTSWLSQIPGLSVSRSRDLGNGVYTVKIRKLTDQASVPNLKLVDGRKALPPVRLYEVVR